MDVVTAFLNGDLDEEINLEVPQGVKYDSFMDVVCNINKALYGLKQAPRHWNAKIYEFLVDQLGFKKFFGDSFRYLNWELTSHTLMNILPYDIESPIEGNNPNSSAWIEGKLSNRFEMKDLGEARTIVGMEIVRDRKQRKLLLIQERYSQNMLERFGMESARPANTSMEEAQDQTKRLEV